METATQAIRLSGISKTYGAVRALRNVSLTVDQGEVVGLVGENGAGKSTLIGILAGNISPDEGELTVYGQPAQLGDARSLGDLGVSTVVQEQALVESMRVYENLFLGIEHLFAGKGLVRRRAMIAKARQMLADDGLGFIAADAPVAELTFPQRQQVEIAKAFVRGGMTGARPVILLDEPTSALSESEAEVLFSLIDRWRERAAFIYVSHILRDVRRLSTRMVVLKDGVVVDDLVNEGITDGQLHERMVGRERSVDYYREDEQRQVQTGDPVIELRGASSGTYFRDVDLAVRPGEIVGLAGVVGSGKSEVAAACAGAVRLTGGELLVAGRRRGRWSVADAIRAGVLYVPPERANDSVFGNASVRANISLGVLDLLRNRVTRLVSMSRERKLAKALVRRLSVKVESIDTPVGELSGGNQQKVVFARWLDRSCTVMVLDDPTRGIDVGTREEIYTLIRQLADRAVAIILCSESLEEVVGVSNRIVVFREGAVSGEVAAPASAKPAEVDIVRLMV